LAVAIPTVTPHGLLERCVSSVLSQKGPAPDLLLIRNDETVESHCSRWEPAGVTVYRSSENLGVAGSWNYACAWAFKRGHEAILLLNDDLSLADPSTLEVFRSASQSSPLRVACLVGRGYSAVCMTRAVYDAVGAFDDGFWPAYFEDTDMAYRLKLADIPSVEVPGASEHFGSATIRMDARFSKLNDQTFILNQERYVAKWGGLPNRESYSIAWNGAVPKPSVKSLVRHRRRR
jgi:GT2 family glycosyltransferase